MSEEDTPLTMSIPEAGKKYYGLSRNGSYDAADRGEIPFVQVGRLRRVPVRAMERLLDSAGKERHSRWSDDRAHAVQEHGTYGDGRRSRRAWGR